MQPDRSSGVRLVQRHIDAARNFVQEKLFPALAIGCRATIADRIAAHDHHLRVGPRGHHRGQGAHEGVIAAIGFKVAVDECQHLVARVQHPAIGKRQGGHQGSAPSVGVDTVKDHLDPVAQHGG